MLARAVWRAREQSDTPSCAHPRFAEPRRHNARNAVEDRTRGV